MVWSASLGLALIFAPSFVFGYHVVPFMQQSFFFDWNPDGQVIPVPTTAQCDTLQIKWSRSTATGPNPIAPYYLQIYTTTSTVPYIIDAGEGLEFNWTVPFPPTTQYQICMFDRYGNTGGCQAVYTVYPALNSTEGSPTCGNITAPPALDVNGTTVATGPLSPYGWIPQCTDLSLIPKNGTPPYTMTIAPALHPPFNITSNTQDPITWTVSLSYATPFFLSLVDSTGLTWANGIIHSGAGDDTKCLAVGSANSKTVAVPVIIGSAIGALALGALIGFIVTALVNRRKYGRLHPDSSTSSLDAPRFPGPPSTQYGMISSLNSTSTRPPQSPNRVGQYEIEPFALPTETHPTSPPDVSAAASDSQSDPSSGPQGRSHVYVVHHDAGRPPVTVYADHADVVELPPTYVRPDDPDPPFQQRRPGPTPRKASNPSTSSLTRS